MMQYINHTGFWALIIVSLFADVPWTTWALMAGVSALGAVLEGLREGARAAAEKRAAAAPAQARAMRDDVR